MNAASASAVGGGAVGAGAPSEPARRAPRRPVKRLREAMDVGGLAADLSGLSLATAIVQTPDLLNFVSFASAVNLRSCNKGLRSLVAQHRWTDAHAAEAAPIRYHLEQWRRSFPAAAAVSLDKKLSYRVTPSTIMRIVDGVQTLFAADRLNSIKLENAASLSGVTRLAVDLSNHFGTIFDSERDAPALAAAMPKLAALDISAATDGIKRPLDDAMFARWASRLAEFTARGWYPRMTVPVFSAALSMSSLRSLHLGCESRPHTLGGTLLALSDEFLSALPSTLEKLALEGFEIDRERGLTGSPLARFVALRALSLPSCSLSDGFLLHAPPSLRELDISSNPRLSGACFAALRGLTKLRIAGMRPKPKKGIGIEALPAPHGLPLHAGLCELVSLVELEAPNNGPRVISDATCEHLRCLEVLDLSHCVEPGVTVAGGFARLPSLRRLKLDEWDVSHFDYDCFAQLKRLQSLSLAGAAGVGSSQPLCIPPTLLHLNLSSLRGALFQPSRLLAALQVPPEQIVALAPPPPPPPVPPPPPPPVPSMEDLTGEAAGRAGTAVPRSLSEAHASAVASRVSALAALRTASAWFAPRGAGAPPPPAKAAEAVARSCELASHAAQVSAARLSECAKAVSEDPLNTRLHGTLATCAADCALTAAREAAKVVNITSSAPVLPVAPPHPRPPLLLTHLTLDGNKSCLFDNDAVSALHRSFPRLEFLSLRGCGQDDAWSTHKAEDWAPLWGTLRSVDFRNNAVPEGVIVAAHAACPFVRVSHPPSPALLLAIERQKVSVQGALGVCCVL